jgi:hypothetical protein
MLKVKLLLLLKAGAPSIGLYLLLLANEAMSLLNVLLITGPTYCMIDVYTLLNVLVGFIIAYGDADFGDLKISDFERLTELLEEACDRLRPKAATSTLETSSEVPCEAPCEETTPKKVTSEFKRKVGGISSADWGFSLCVLGTFFVAFGVIAALDLIR